MELTQMYDLKEFTCIHFGKSIQINWNKFSKINRSDENSIRQLQ